MKDQENKVVITEKELKEIQDLIKKGFKEKSNKKLFFDVFWQSALFIGLGILSLIILNYTTDIFKSNKGILNEQNNCSITQPANCKSEDICLKNGFVWSGAECLYKNKEDINNVPSEFPDFDYYNKLSQNNNKLNIITSVDSSVVDGKILGRNNVKIKTWGKFSSVYLYINVSVDNNEPLTIWDSIYVTLKKPNYKPMGGHIFRPLSLKMPASNTTKLLFDLRKIPYTFLPYSESNQYYNADWFDLLNSNNRFEIESFLSTSRVGGKIIEISLAYECNSTTPNCNIQIDN